MSFRRRGKSLHKEAVEWREWKAKYADLLKDCGLAPSVLRSADDWRYFLRYGYHCDGPYPAIDFNATNMTPGQLGALFRLLDLTLTDEEKARGNAMWRPQSHGKTQTDSLPGVG